MQAFIRGLEFDPRSERLRELRTETEGELTGQEITAVLDGLRTAEGNAPDGCSPARLFRVDIALRYPQVYFIHLQLRHHTSLTKQYEFAATVHAHRVFTQDCASVNHWYSRWRTVCLLTYQLQQTAQQSGLLIWIGSGTAMQPDHCVESCSRSVYLTTGRQGAIGTASSPEVERRCGDLGGCSARCMSTAEAGDSPADDSAADMARRRRTGDLELGRARRCGQRSRGRPA